jgi:hypothetical protein
MLANIRNGLIRSNTVLEKIMPLLTPTAIVVGVLNESRLLPFAGLVPWIFAFMTLIGSLKSNLKDLLRVLLKPQKLVVLMVILHIVMPLIGWLVASAVFPGDPYTVTGFVLLFAIPTGVVSVVWVSIYGGNIAHTDRYALVTDCRPGYLVFAHGSECGNSARGNDERSPMDGCNSFGGRDASESMDKRQGEHSLWAAAFPICKSRIVHGCFH